MSSIAAAPAARVIGRALAFFRTGADRPPATDDAAELGRLYERSRWSVFLSLTLGYGVFYVARLNLGVVKKSAVDAGVLSAPELGLMGSAFFFVYAAGRFTNGFLSDRANIRRFMATALLLSAAANLVLGSTTLAVLFVVLWGLNGWFQSVGSAPSVVSLSQWFTQRERGTYYGLWSTSHAIGGVISYFATTALVFYVGWEWGFWGPALVCGVAALVLFRTLRDRPQTYGLPPVWEYKGEPAPPQPRQASVGALQLEVLRNPAVWILSLASAFMYVSRYGIESWGQFYLEAGKGYTTIAAGRVMMANQLAQIGGTILSGAVSDRFFGASRKVPALVSGALMITGLTSLYLVPAGHAWLDAATMAVFGLGLGALLAYLGGMWAIDVVSPRAAGAAMGVVGIFSYAGAGLQDLASGLLIGEGERVDGATVYSFGGLFAVLIGAAVLSFILSATIRTRPRPSELIRSPGARASHSPGAS